MHILMCSLRQRRACLCMCACVSSDVTQIINCDLKTRRAPTDIRFVVCVRGSPAVGGQSRLTVRVHARTTQARPDKYV